MRIHSDAGGGGIAAAGRCLIHGVLRRAVGNFNIISCALKGVLLPGFFAGAADVYSRTDADGKAISYGHVLAEKQVTFWRPFLRSVALTVCMCTCRTRRVVYI